jgi:hypothetical protein
MSFDPNRQKSVSVELIRQAESDRILSSKRLSCMSGPEHGVYGAAVECPRHGEIFGGGWPNHHLTGELHHLLSSRECRPSYRSLRINTRINPDLVLGPP